MTLQKNLVSLAVALACSACGTEAPPADKAGAPALRSCTADDKIAVVTDIDETLTLSDEEFILQFGNADYDPIERAAACKLIAAYHARGYFVFYVTARPPDMDMGGTGLTSEQATIDWLERRGCPQDARTSLTFSTELVFGETAHAYKAAALAAFEADGYTLAYAYGNAVSDIDAYADAGIPKDVTFIIGNPDDGKGTVAIAGDGYAAHLQAQLPTVPELCAP